MLFLLFPVEVPMLDLYKIPKLYFYRWILWWLQPFYIKLFKLSAVGLENVPKEGPYLLIGNHSHKLDPFFIGALIRRPIFQMAAKEYFRIPFMRRFMWAMGAFPMRKDVKDIRPIRHAKKIMAKGFPIALYPEGGRNWDGQTLPIIKRTAKMVKFLNVPVVAVVSEGNYLAWPRWANKRRRSPITIHYSKPVTFDKGTTDEEIIDWIQKAIDHNDNYTKIGKIDGENPAEGLTRLLWRCPACRTLEGLIEMEGTLLSCNACGRKWKVTLDCRMKQEGSDSWKPIKEYADSMFRANEIIPLDNDFGTYLKDNEQVYLQSGEITLYHEPDYPKLKKIDDGILLLSDRGLIFIKKSDGNSIRYRFEDIRGRSTEKNSIFQIVKKDDDLGRFEMPHESCLKWELYYDFIRKKSGFYAEDK